MATKNFWWIWNLICLKELSWMVEFWPVHVTLRKDLRTVSSYLCRLRDVLQGPRAGWLRARCPPFVAKPVRAAALWIWAQPFHLYPVTTALREKMLFCCLQDKARGWSTWAVCLGLRQVICTSPCVLSPCLTPPFLWSSCTSYGAPTNCIDPSIKCPGNVALLDQIKQTQIPWGDFCAQLTPFPFMYQPAVMLQTVETC